MISHPHITKIIAVITAVAVCVCFCAMMFADTLVEAVGGKGVSMEYESALFTGDTPLDINILMDDEQWTQMLENPLSEEYVPCDVEIGGKSFYRVAIRPKGNTSLSNIAKDPTTDRFSFKLEFDHYVDGQTCYGLDKLVLNNNYADATNMKEALIYDMYQYMGADASLYRYAKISVNGAYWGVYLALEAVEDSFFLRRYGTERGELYKPDSMKIGGGNPGGGMNPPDGANQMQNGKPPAPPDGANQAQNGEPPALPDDANQAQNGEPPALPDGANQLPDFGRNPGKGGGPMSGGGANLNYSDDELDSYSTIWEGAVSKTSDADHQRVVTALKNISQGNDLEQFLDIDNLLRYMAVHVFSVNEDSLSGNMAHNYYLYENSGRLNILPWDYNLALGGMGHGRQNAQSSNATAMVNSPIDNPFSGTDFFDTLLENEQYHAQYQEYLQKLVDEYLLGDGFTRFYARTRSQIDDLVKTDPTAFYSYEKYDAAANTLYEVVKLRGQSIQGQLSGAIPSTREQQQANPNALIDASHIDVSVMGTMEMGGGKNFEQNPMSHENSPSQD